MTRKCGVCGEPAQYIAHYDRRLDPDGPLPPKWQGLEVPLCEADKAEPPPPGWAYEVLE